MFNAWTQGLGYGTAECFMHARNVFPSLWPFSATRIHNTFCNYIPNIRCDGGLDIGWFSTWLKLNYSRRVIE